MAVCLSPCWAHILKNHSGLGSVTLIAPYATAQAKLVDALKGAHALTWTAPNTRVTQGGAALTWFERDAALPTGMAADPALARCAALTDQSDAWAILVLHGPATLSVLARLMSLDLRLPQFPEGATVRIELAHMPAGLTRLTETSFEITVFRSMARTAHRKIATT